MTTPKKGTSSRQDARSDEYQRKPVRPVAELIGYLAELEAATRPQDGDKSTRNKDRKATEALRFANSLVEAVAGWAIDHQMGLALRGRSSILEVSAELSHHPLYAVALEEVDDHQNEIAGAQIRNKSIPPSLARQALLNLLQANPGAFPESVVSETVRGLESLDYNEILPIFKPRKGRRKVSLSELYIAHTNVPEVKRARL